MLSIQSSSSLYRPRDRSCGNSFADDGVDPSAELLARPRINSETPFSSDGFLNSPAAPPTVASMAAIILSTSPDLASSFFHGYFRGDTFNPTKHSPKLSTAIKSTTKPIPIPPPEKSTPPPEDSTPPPEDSTPPPEDSTPPPEKSTPPPEELTPPPEVSTPPPPEVSTPPPPEESRSTTPTLSLSLKRLDLSAKETDKVKDDEKTVTTTTTTASPLKSSLRPKTVAAAATSLPKTKKSVKFADDNGLPLVIAAEFQRVNYFEARREEIFQNSLPRQDSLSSSSPSSFSSIHYAPPTPPPLPVSFTSLESPPSSSSSSSSSLTSPPEETRKLVCDFQMPCYNYAAFRDRVWRQKVSLEKVLISGNRIAGCVRVVNRVFDKRVFVRYTKNNWRTTEEVQCKYVNDNDNHFYGGRGGGGAMPPTDAFAFQIDGRTPISVRDEIQFCIRFEAGGGGGGVAGGVAGGVGGGDHYWDNNDGANYAIITKEFFEQRRTVREMEKCW